MKTPLKRKADEEHFTQNGYAVFPFLNEAQLQQIRLIYQNANREERLQQQQFYGVNYSLGTLSAEENNRIMQPVGEIIRESLQEHFKDYEILGCVFITKPPKTFTAFVYHQDWSYTDEKNHAFATCWIPLLDTNKQNGCMSVINGSQNFFEIYRSESLESARIDFEKIPAEIKTDIEQKAGSCLAFHQAVFHGSYPNVSEQSRPVLAFVVKHIDSPVLHYVKEENKISGYQLSVAAFNKMLTQIPRSAMPDDAQKISTIENIAALPEADEIISQWRISNLNHRLLKDKSLHEQFQRNGFLILRNVISSAKIIALRNLYMQHFTTQKGMYVTHHNERNVERNKMFRDKIFELLSDFFEDRFIHYKPLIAHFAVKSPGDESLFNLHEDWSIVREELFGVIHCWVPLQEVNETNGTLAVLPKSHLCFHNYRSGTCPIRFFSFASFEEEIIRIEAKAGDVVLYHPSLFHGSEANRSDAERLAVIAAAKHSDAANVYYHQIENEVWLYEMNDEDAFGRLDDLAKGDEPLGKKIEKVQRRVLDISDAEAVQKLREHCTLNLLTNVEV